MLRMVIQVTTGKATLGLPMCSAGSGAAFDASFKGRDAEQTASRLLVLITVYNSSHFDIIIVYLGTLMPKDSPSVGW